MIEEECKNNTSNDDAEITEVPIENAVTDTSNSHTIDGHSNSKTYYEVLNVPLDATQHAIFESYKQLSVMYHPDRCVGDEDAKETLSLIVEAFNVLGDGAKKAAYDASIGNAIAVNVTPIKRTSFSAASAIVKDFSKVVLNSSTAIKSAINNIPAVEIFSNDIPDESTFIAHCLCKSKQFQAPGKLNFKSDEFLEQVKEEGPSAFRSNLQEVIFSDLEWGLNSYAKVERLQSHYYRVYVSPEHIQNGLILNCKSADKDSFKLFVYHHSGVLLSCDDSEVSRDGRSTHITKFFNTRFPCYHLVNGVENSQNHVSRRKGSVKEDVPVARNAPESASSDANMSNANASADTVAALPPLFHCVEKFETCDYTLPGPGYYLVAVFGENFIAKSAYTISVVSTKNNSPEIQHIQSQDTAMLQLRDQIRDLQGRYVEAKAAYDQVLNEISKTSEALAVAIHTRDVSYRSFVVDSFQSYVPHSEADDSESGSGSEIASGNNVLPSGAGVTPTPLRTVRVRRDSLADAQHTVSQAASHATATASAAASIALTKGAESASVASGWVSSKLSAGVGRFHKMKTSLASSIKGNSNSEKADKEIHANTGVGIMNVTDDIHVDDADTTPDADSETGLDAEDSKSNSHSEVLKEVVTDGQTEVEPTVTETEAEVLTTSPESGREAETVKV